jgi:hypothetical protein
MCRRKRCELCSPWRPRRRRRDPALTSYYYILNSRAAWVRPPRPHVLHPTAFGAAWQLRYPLARACAFYDCSCPAALGPRVWGDRSRRSVPAGTPRGEAVTGVARKRQTAPGFSQGSANGSPSLIDQADDLALLWETVQLLFGEDERAVIGHLEYAAAGRLQGQVGDLAPVGADKLFRQTDGVRQIVSDDAELNGDVHVMPPVIKYCSYSSMGLLKAATRAGRSAARRRVRGPAGEYCRHRSLPNHRNNEAQDMVEHVNVTIWSREVP